MSAIRRIGSFVVLLALFGLTTFSGVNAQGKNWQGVNTTGKSPVCETFVQSTQIQWSGNTVTAINGGDLEVRTINRAALGDKWMATLDLQACNVGFTPDYTLDESCQTAPITLHAATAGRSPGGVAAIEAANNQLWRYFAGFDVHGNMDTILFRLPCPSPAS